MHPLTSARRASLPGMLGSQQPGELGPSPNAELGDHLAGVDVILRAKVPALEEELQLGREVRNAIGRLQHRLCPRKANRFACR